MRVWRLDHEDVQRVVALVAADVRNTIGARHEHIVASNAMRLWEFAGPEDILDRVVNDTQQEIHDEFIDTAWPRCPRHSNHHSGFETARGGASGIRWRLRSSGS
jgi:hypothetical protein